MYDCMHILLLCANECNLEYVHMLKYVEVVHSSRLYMTLIGYIIYDKLCMLVNVCIPNTIIYNCNILLCLIK